MAWFKPKSTFDKVFEYGIILKGVDGLLELVAGISLFFIKPDDIREFASFITQKQLLGDPHSKVANYVVHSSQHITNAATTFAIVYLLIHATVKLVAVVGILRGKIWAYPFSLITLGILFLYQLYSIFTKPSIGMVLLSTFDIIIIGLIWHEYKLIRSGERKLEKKI
jgi:uncharacterized membrane protein